MNLIRKSKISKITNVELTETENEILNFVSSKLNGLTSFKYINNDNVFYLDSEGTWMLEQDNKGLHIRWNGFWNKLEEDFSIDRNAIKIIINHFIEKILKIKSPFINLRLAPSILNVESDFKKSYFNNEFSQKD